MGHIFPHSQWIRRDQYLPVFSPNAGKYGPEESPYLETFQAVTIVAFVCISLGDFVASFEQLVVI